MPLYERTEYTYHLQRTEHPENIRRLYDTSGLHGLRELDGGHETLQGTCNYIKTTGACKQTPIHRPLHTTVGTKTTKATNRRPSTNLCPWAPTFNIKMERPNI